MSSQMRRHQDLMLSENSLESLQKSIEQFQIPTMNDETLTMMSSSDMQGVLASYHFSFIIVRRNSCRNISVAGIHVRN